MGIETPFITPDLVTVAVEVGRRSVTVDDQGEGVFLVRGFLSWACGVAFPTGWRPWAAWHSERRVREAVSDDGTGRPLVPDPVSDGPVQAIEAGLLLLSTVAFVVLVLYRHAG